jgi:hypothetical protein
MLECSYRDPESLLLGHVAGPTRPYDVGAVAIAVDGAHDDTAGVSPNAEICLADVFLIAQIHGCMSPSRVAFGKTTLTLGCYNALGDAVKFGRCGSKQQQVTRLKCPYVQYAPPLPGLKR